MFNDLYCYSLVIPVAFDTNRNTLANFHSRHATSDTQAWRLLCMYLELTCSSWLQQYTERSPQTWCWCVRSQQMVVKVRQSLFVHLVPLCAALSFPTKQFDCVNRATALSPMFEWTFNLYSVTSGKTCTRIESPIKRKQKCLLNPKHTCVCLYFSESLFAGDIGSTPNVVR